MNLSLTSLRRTVTAVATFLVIIAIVWWALWSIASAQYRNVIDGWIESGRAAGYQITYDQRELFGFPRHVIFRFTNVKWQNTNNIGFHADDIDIAATPWQWRKFDAKFKHHVEIDAPVDEDGHTLILGGENGRAHVELDPDGFWRFSRVSLTQAKLGQTPNYVVLAESLEASAERPEKPAADHTQVGLTLHGNAENVTLPADIPSPFGLKMARLDVDLRVMGAVPDFRRRDSTDIWNKDMGVVDFDRLRTEWGPLKLTAKGTMGFDDDLQPEGAFAGAVENHQAVLKALMEHDFIAKRQEAMLNSALSLFAKPSKFENDSGIEIPITVQLGGLFLGPVRIFTFPEIEWPQNPPPASAPAPAP